MVVVAALVVATLLGGRGESPEQRLDAFLAAWSRGADAAAAEHTTAPTRATAALSANRAGLDGATLRAQVVGDVREEDARAHARVRLTWQVPGIGPWSYETTIALDDTGVGGWRVRWAPTVVHPRLRADSRLGTIRTPQPRGRILDREGRPLVEERPVARIGVVAGEIDDPAATARALADVVEIDARRYERAIRNGGPQQFVEAITLRPEDYAAVEAAVGAIAGVRVLDATAHLAPTRAFARALLGEVRELSAEQLGRLGDEYAVGDVGGQWGLGAAFEERLAGTPDRAIVIRVGGRPRARLHVRRGRRAADLRTTLDADAQAAAEQALAQLAPDQHAAVVAVQPSSGDVLAVANRPIDDSFNRAFEGRYPPGSTFKIVTAAALLEADLVTPETPVECPTTVEVGGRPFKNFAGAGGTTLPFAAAFAQSCNTAFVAFASRLAPDALAEVGERFGFGRELGLPLTAFGGRVPRPDDAAATAAAMIGQDRTLASPLAVASMVATVADGRWRMPRLVADDPRVSGDPLDAELVAQLRALTRQVVTAGTGGALATLPGEVHGKSGTAEYGGGDPPPTHAWFAAYRDDVAVAVLVEDGSSGSAVAAPIAQRFFSALDAGATPAALADGAA